MSLAIQTDGLRKCFRRQQGAFQRWAAPGTSQITAVEGVSIEVAPGEIFGLLGPNGAGKTTLIKMLCTLLVPTSGQASIWGHDIVREPQAVKRLVGLIASDERSFFWRLTGRQNLQFFAALSCLPRREANHRIDELCRLLDLTEMADTRFNEYSTGIRQRLAIARGLLSRPKVLFMDEPTKGLDPLSAHALLGLIRQRVVGSLGSTIVLTSHILRDIEALCDRVAILKRGRVIACGDLDALRRVARPEETYRLHVLGLDAAVVDRLAGLPGIVHCAVCAQKGEVTELELGLRKESTALSSALADMLGAGCTVLRCTLEREDLEDVFIQLVRTGESSAPAAAVPADA